MKIQMKERLEIPSVRITKKFLVLNLSSTKRVKKVATMVATDVENI